MIKLITDFSLMVAAVSLALIMVCTVVVFIKIFLTPSRQEEEKSV